MVHHTALLHVRHGAPKITHTIMPVSLSIRLLTSKEATSSKEAIIISKDNGFIMCLDSRQSHSTDITIICQKSTSLISDLAVPVITLLMKPGRRHRPAAVA